MVDEAGDAGAFYMYGDSVARAQLERGNVVLYNYWHHLPYNETFKGVACVSRMGIYIDNFNGAITVYGNVFDRIDFNAGAVFFGTNDDIVENNVFHCCFRGVYMTDRTWLYDKVNKPPKFVIDATLAKAAANPVWARRYPRLTTFPRQAKDTSPFLLGNVIARNITYRCDEFIHGSRRVMGLARIEQNWTGDDPGFKDAEHGDFHLDPNSPAVLALGFEPLPLDEIGLYNDALRATWPVVHPCGNYETLRVEEAVNRKRAAEMPACAATPATASIVIDGRLDPSEWGGLDKAQAVVLARTPTQGPTLARPSYLWLRWDKANLYLGLLNELNPGERARPKASDAASWWKDVDMAEVIFEGPWGKNAPEWWPQSKKHGPLFYLPGDCAGRADTYCAAGTPPATASRSERTASFRRTPPERGLARPFRWQSQTTATASKSSSKPSAMVS